MTTLETIVENALYETIRTLPDGKSIVMDAASGKVYFKKTLTVYHPAVFSWLKEHPDPHVPRIHAFWETDGVLTVIEEFIQGRTLEEILTSEAPSFEEKKRILLAVCDGLTFLHGAEPPIIHRDLKASNIMLTEDGVVKIIDYDAARIYERSLKADTVLIGTHGIAAPEQYGFAQSDARTDLYALGKLIDRMLPEVEGVQPLVEKATRLDPSRRFSSAAQIRKALEKLTETVPGKSLLKRLPGFGSKKKSVRILSRCGAVLAVVLALLAIWLYYWIPETTVRRPAYEAGIAALNGGNWEEALTQFAICGEGYRDTAEQIRAANELRINDALDALEASAAKPADYAGILSAYKVYLEEAPDIAGPRRDALLTAWRKEAYEAEEAFSHSSASDDAETALTIWDAVSTASPEEAGQVRRVEDQVRGRIAELLDQDLYNRAEALCALLTGRNAEDAEALTQETLYREGLFHREKGDNTQAIRCFSQIPDYLDAQEQYRNALYESAEERIEKKDYLAAIDVYEKLSGFRDADARILETKALYCRDTAEDPNSTTYEFIKELTAAGYDGAEALQTEIYSWHARLSWKPNYHIGYMQEEAIQADLTGGPEGGKTTVRFRITCEEDGTSLSYTPDGTFQKGDTAFCTLYNTSADTVIFGKTYTVKVYDGNGALIAEKTGVFEDFQD